MTSLLKNISKALFFTIFFSDYVAANDFFITDIPIQEGGRIKPLDTLSLIHI